MPDNRLQRRFQATLTCLCIGIPTHHYSSERSHLYTSTFEISDSHSERASQATESAASNYDVHPESAHVGFSLHPTE